MHKQVSEQRHGGDHDHDREHELVWDGGGAGGSAELESLALTRKEDGRQGMHGTGQPEASDSELQVVSPAQAASGKPPVRGAL